MTWKTLDDMEFEGKRVLVRVDINVPVEKGKVTDATRIEKIAPTVRDILDRGGRVLLVAHFGRPKGKVVLDMTLRVTIPALENVLARHVTFVETFDGAEAATNDVVLLENIRFHPGEEANDPAFAAELAGLAEIYCQDAFSAAHRAHASTEGLARLMPSCAGRQMAAELRAREAALSTPKRPVGAVVGGAKVSTKIALLENLVEKLDVLIIGGGMANTFLAAQGADMGNSLQEPDLHETARDILAKAATTGCRVILPVDGKLARSFGAGVPFEVAALGAGTALEADQMVLDAGPLSIKAVTEAFDGLAPLLWHGPLGACEIAPFDEATMGAARHAAALTSAGRLITVAGGGDTVAALHAAGVADQFSYISTAGGAFLEWMEGKTLPGVAALENCG